MRLMQPYDPLQARLLNPPSGEAHSPGVAFGQNRVGYT